MAHGPVLIVGCGYSGRALARRLSADGHRVTGVVRHPEHGAAVSAVGGMPLALDLARQLTAPDGRRRLADLVAEHSAVVYAVGPERVAGSEAFGDHTAAFLEVLREAAPAPGFVYLSSTGVYGDRDGEWVDEATPMGEDVGPRGRVRQGVEHALALAHREWGLRVTVLRVAGIYGPGRHVGRRILKGDYRVIEADPPLTVNRIHVDDLAQVIDRALGLPGGGETYVVADNHPATLREVADYTAGLLKVPPPPGEPMAAARARMGEANFHLVADRKRCRNTKMIENLGVTLAYPTFREGMRQALGVDGLLPL